MSGCCRGGSWLAARLGRGRGTSEQERAVRPGLPDGSAASDPDGQPGRSVEPGRSGRFGQSGPERSGLPGFGLGALTLLILVLVGLSGLYMALFFQAGPADAWHSVQFMERSVPLGSFARSLHGWGAFLAVICTAVHLLAVVWRRAYRAPRELNWLLGLGLMLLLAAAVVTGYMLPWDFRSYWIVKTMSNWLEGLPLFAGVVEWVIYGNAPNGQVPVGRWFALHVLVIPLLIGLAATAHMALFLRHGPSGEDPDAIARAADPLAAPDDEPEAAPAGMDREPGTGRVQAWRHA